MQAVAVTIKGFRKAQKLTQDQFGDLVGVTGRTVSTWERAKGGPDLDKIPDLIRVLRLSQDEATQLFFGSSPDEQMATLTKDMSPSERDRFFAELRAEVDSDASLFAFLRDLLAGRRASRNGGQ